MPFLQSEDPAIALFSAQFVESGDGYIYRRNKFGAAYEVTREQRDRFVNEFRRSYRWTFWLTFVAAISLIILGMLLYPAYFEEGERSGIFALAALIAASLWLAIRRQYGAPMRALNVSEPVAPPLTREERHAVHFKSVGWPLLIILSLLAAVVAMSMVSRLDDPTWSDIAWLAGASLFLVLGVRAILLKWRYRDREGAP